MVLSLFGLTVKVSSDNLKADDVPSPSVTTSLAVSIPLVSSLTLKIDL